MTTAAKLQLRPGSTVALVGAPTAVDVAVSAEVQIVADPGAADAVVAFVTTADDLDSVATPALTAARDGRLASIAYPKARQLGTDLNRDRLAAGARDRGLRPVRQVAIDDVWSALRFRPA